MTTFRVWAPVPDAVELALGDGSRHAMEPSPSGWWTVVAPGAGPGTAYGFVLDGDGPFPDPRSPFQPHGVHSLSRLVDHQAFTWTDAAFEARPLEDAVIYELHVGTFTEAGTFAGAIGLLDDLVALGVSHVELMPVVEFPGRRGWGYDGVDLFAPHHAYGGPEGLKQLVDECHARGLAVLIDVVYNHLGPDGNYLARFGPYFSHRYTTPWGDAVNFDAAGSDEVRRFVVDNALMWLRDYHADGLRVDAVHEIYDKSAVHILEQLAEEVHVLGETQGRRLVVIAESDLNDPRLVHDIAAGGYGLDAAWNDDFRHALHVTITGEADAYHGQYTGLPDLAKSVAEVYAYDGRYSAFRGRVHGRPVGDVPRTRFVGFLQNHDQVGNRAMGERSAHLMPPGALRVGAALVLLGPFVPMLFAGEEWGASTPFLYFTDHQHEDLAEAVRAGRRAEFPAFLREGLEVPDPQAVSTFERSRLRWDEIREPRHAELLEWHRSLIAFRRAHPELRDGTSPVVRCDPHERWLVLERPSVVIAANLGAATARAPLSSPGGGSTSGTDASAASARAATLVSDPAIRVGADTVELPPWSVAVLER
jgi:maltooligosyltrehalose trehalohydrolase